MFDQMMVSAPLAMLVIFLLMLFFFKKLALIIPPTGSSGCISDCDYGFAGHIGSYRAYHELHDTNIYNPNCST